MLMNLRGGEEVIMQLRRKEKVFSNKTSVSYYVEVNINNIAETVRVKGKTQSERCLLDVFFLDTDVLEIDVEKREKVDEKTGELSIYYLIFALGEINGNKEKCLLTPVTKSDRILLLTAWIKEREGGD